MGMRVLQVAYEYPPLVVGGMSAHLEGICTALGAAGHEVVVLSRHHPDAPDDVTIGHVRIIRAYDNLPWTPNDQPIAEVINHNHHLTKLADRLGEWTPDVVHTHDWLGAWTGDALAGRYRVPLVATVHATERGRQQGWLTSQHSHGVNAAEWWLTYQANEVICCSEFMADEVRDGFSLPGDKLHVIANGIDPNWSTESEVMASVPVVAKSPLVTAWGRLVYEKGFQTLIDSVVEVKAKIPNVRVVIAGRGPHRDELEAQVTRLGLEKTIILPGFITTPQLSWLLKNSACAVIPSYYEPFGMVALEAMAAGSPVVVSATGGLKEVIAGADVAAEVPPADAPAMAKAIIGLLGDKQAADALAQRAVAHVKDNFGWATIAAQTVGVYERAVRGK